MIYVQEQASDDDADGYGRLERFAQRTQTLPPFHVYQMTNERLWNACQAGLRAADVITFLRGHSEHPLPLDMQKYVVSTMARWRKLHLLDTRDGLTLTGDVQLLREVSQLPGLGQHVHKSRRDALLFPSASRVAVQMALAREGYHVQREEPTAGAKKDVPVSLRRTKTLRPYQEEAVRSIVDTDRQSGVIVLPCGAGKTVVGVGILAGLKTSTLILVPNEAAAEQWRRHVCEWTDMAPSEVGIDNGKSRLRAVTITTYQRLTARRHTGEFQQFRRYTRHPWGLVIFDEVHLLPAPLFRLAAELQSRRRVGLSATLIREDGHASDVFSLVGPKCYEAHAVDLVRNGYLSSVQCIEVQVPLSEECGRRYAAATLRERHRIAADNSEKLSVIEALCRRHKDQRILIMGHYTDFLFLIAKRLHCPVLTGATPPEERLETYAGFRDGKIPVLVLSRIANVAVDLPNADIAIQVSGLFGSRQEEAQRLGRILRPKEEGACFYTLVSFGTVEEKTAKHRQRFLVEHGFAYNQTNALDVLYERGTNDLEVK